MPDMWSASFHWLFREILIPVPVDGLKIVPILCSATPNTPFSMILPCFRTAPKRHVAERPADTSPFSLHAFSGLTKAIPPTCRVRIGRKPPFVPRLAP